MGNKENLKNYLSKIHNFASCLQSDKWIKKANENDICLIFLIANDIQETIKKLKSSKFNEKLSRLYPNVDFSRSSELIIEQILKSPHTDNNIALESIKQFIKFHSEDELSIHFCKLLSEKKLKDNLILLNQDLQPKSSKLKILEAKSTFSLWEELSSESPDIHRKIIIDMLNTKTSALLSITDMNPICRNNEKIIGIVVDYLNCQNNVKLWSKLLHESNLNTVVSLCDKYPTLLEGVLNFFRIFENEVKDEYDEDFNVKWMHDDLGFDKFVTIVQGFLRKGGVVRDKVDKFLIGKRNDFDCNFAFWAEVSSCVY